MTAYSRWAAGLCPCCGMDIEPWEWQDVITDPEPLVEGVMVCGRCVANEHLSRPGYEEEGRQAMLEAIVRRDDQPIDDLLARGPAR